MKQNSIFYKNKKINISLEKIREIEKDVTWWMSKSYDDLYNLMFSNSLLRSWFVLSYGDCPRCNKSVLLYNWVLDAKNHPYKVQCPHCDKLFPENDFETFYKSGLDENGRFSYKLANRELLGNDTYIDDGNGYTHINGETYRFIAYYLTRGQWEQLITDGVNKLALAYLVTNNKEYARRSLIILHSISRFYKEFDFKKEGLMYEKANKSNGYVNYWVTSCNDMKYLSISYDMIFDAIKDDKKITNYLDKPFSLIQKNIEENIFMDATKNIHKIFSNPPATEIALLFIKIVLSWPEKKSEIYNDLDELINMSTFIDGLPGEKGVMGYAAIGPSLLLDLFNQLSLINEKIVFDVFNKYPILYKTYRFHINCWYMNKYYPHCGDTGTFNIKNPTNASLKTFYPLDIQKIIKKSPEWFIYMLYKHFKDSDFLKVLFINNGYSYDDLLKDDIFLTDNEKLDIISDIKKVIDNEGTSTNQISINYEQYRLALLHSGSNENKKMAFMLYESGANHSHREALNFGLFFKGKNIISGFGYPPVGYGGWDSDEVTWYRHPASHNIVVIDNKDHVNLPIEETFLRRPKYGKTLLFENNDLYKAICAEAKEYVDAKKYERLLAIIDIDEKDSYILDVFKVEGGKNHRKFQRSSFLNIKHENLSLTPSNYNEYAFMRNFTTDSNPINNYSITFHDDKTNFKYTDLTINTKVTICESWVDLSKTNRSNEEKQSIWIPTLFVEKDGPSSTFISIMEVFNTQSRIKNIKRIGNEDTIKLIITLDNGHVDHIHFDNDYKFIVNRK